ncbi:unnamed protein product [Lepidochelys kempii]
MRALHQVNNDLLHLSLSDRDAARSRELGDQQKSWHGSLGSLEEQGHLNLSRPSAMKILYLLFAVVLLLFQAAPGSGEEARIPSCRFMGGYCIRPGQHCPSGRFLNGPCGFRERCCKR